MQTISLHKLVLPDGWQSEAIQSLRAGHDVILDAPTGAGKTYVFEKYMEGANLSRQVIYTVPTRALANDKFAEWKMRGWRIGITTGDITHEAAAPILVATLEAVQGMALRAPHPALLVVDEYQWLRDPQRGNHYEGLILSLPPDVKLLLLSGCVENPQEVQRWLVRLGRSVRLIRHSQRPVPLEEYDLDTLERQVPKRIEGHWTRRIYAALKEDLGPILIFAPHRNDAERMARHLASSLPPAAPLTLLPEQERLVPKDLAKLLVQRIAYHHSGLPHAARGGVVEPLAKAGQLRVVVATLGLSAGINFSLRSVLIVSTQYKAEGLDRSVEPHEILQMAGRAGRRGLDEVGYFLSTHHTPRLGHGSPLRLKRAAPLPWSFMLRRGIPGESFSPVAADFSRRLLSETPPPTGDEVTRLLDPATIPCGQLTDAGRSRLVRRTRRPFRGCKQCLLRPDCLKLPMQPGPLWQMQRLGLLDRKLRLTPRGMLAGGFSGPEGLAVAAVAEDREYDVSEAIFDLANLFCGERFSQQEPRWSGRLAISCQKIFGRFSLDGWLQWGIPVQYGAGGGTIIRQICMENRRKGQLTDEFAGAGDIHRLLIEWKSLLRQIAEARGPENDRWQKIRDEAQQCLRLLPQPQLPILPSLSAEQRKTVSHHFM